LIVIKIEAEMPAAKTPYSTAALPDSSLRKAPKFFIICAALIRL
jgi:hypothetical protein